MCIESAIVRDAIHLMTISRARDKLAQAEKKLEAFRMSPQNWERTSDSLSVRNERKRRHDELVDMIRFWQKVYDEARMALRQ